MSVFGIHTEFYAYEGFSHGFGIVIGPIAECWLYQIMTFWEKQTKQTQSVDTMKETIVFILILYVSLALSFAMLSQVSIQQIPLPL